MSDNNEHIDSSAFRKYLSDKTTLSEKSAFEESIEEGSFEEEALEGFKSLENDSAAIAAIDAIDKEVAKRTGRKADNKVAFPIWKAMSIAASVVLFLGIGFFVTQSVKNQTSLAVNNDESATEDADVMVEEMPLEDNVGNLIFDVNDSSFVSEDERFRDAELDEISEVEEEMPAPPPPRISVVEDKPEFEEIASKDDNDFDDNYGYEQSEDLAADYAPVSTTTAASKSNAQEVVSEYNRNESSEKKVTANAPSSLDKAEAAESNSYFNIAKVNYTSGNYTTAIKYFQNAIDNGQNTTESNYFIGLSYYNLNKNVKALKYLDTVLNTNSPWLSSAKWYKVLIYEERGDDNSAKKLLEDLANGNSAFKNQAADKLKAY